tara:strand:- start:8 stop:610 length:603 start_codon:yes stop_codon:yes gene_type:complete
MSNLAFCAAPIDGDNLLTDPSKINNGNNSNNKTLKKRWKYDNNQENVQNIINQIHHNSNNDDDNNFGDFNPPPPPELQNNSPEQIKQTEYNPKIQDDTPDGTPNEIQSDEPVNTKGFYNLPTSVTDSYFVQSGPLYNRINQQDITKDQLIEKINYMIHLLEEQRDEKSGQVMEEVILYSFLGIFMIFIVDSFARAGKYHR